MIKLKHKLTNYYATAIISLIFAIVGFSYNTWRLEVSEDNSNVRTAAFAVLNELAELEQNIYAAHYDQDPIKGNPRRGWVKVGLIVDLSQLISPSVHEKAQQLKAAWAAHWQAITSNNEAVEDVVRHITETRMEIKNTLRTLD